MPYCCGHHQTEELAFHFRGPLFIGSGTQFATFAAGRDQIELNSVSAAGYTVFSACFRSPVLSSFGP